VLLAGTLPTKLQVLNLATALAIVAAKGHEQESAQVGDFEASLNLYIQSGIAEGVRLEIQRAFADMDVQDYGSDDDKEKLVQIGLNSYARFKVGGNSE